MNKFIKKIILLVLIFILPNNKTIYADMYKGLTDLSVGKVVTFGTYYINDIQKKEDIEWYVLDIFDNKALLFSKYILDAKIFSSNKKGGWETSDLREFLNKYFYNEAFDLFEKQIVLPVEHDGFYNNKYCLLGNLPTTDKVFLLSDDEIHKYLYNENGIIENPIIYGIGTNYAYHNNLSQIVINQNQVDEKKISSYWLRTIGFENDYEEVVCYNGAILEDGYYQMRFDCGVRPAIIINIEN